MTESTYFESVWDALSDTPEEAANLRLRAELMDEIVSFILKQNWNREEAARRCGVTCPRMDELLEGTLSEFSLDALINLATSLGLPLRIKVGV